MLEDWDRNYWFNIGKIVTARMLLQDALAKDYETRVIKDILKNCPTAFDDEFYQIAGKPINTVFEIIEKIDSDSNYERLRNLVKTLIEQIDKALPSEVVSQYNDIF